ncbi:MAG: DUF2490 domain-containing protein [Bryobacteraceae bacterium]
MQLQSCLHKEETTVSMMKFLALHKHTLWVLAAAIAPLASAQTVQDTNAHAWFMYFGDHPVSDKWGIHLEGQARRANTGLTWQQLLLRPGVNYQLNPNLMLTAGYAYVRSWPYGDYPAKAPFPEHRFFEQALIRHKIKQIPIQHRLRLEQRLIATVPAPQAEVEGWQTRNRFRYMLRGDIPLPMKINGQKRFGIALYDEFFVQFGANRGIRYLDQNRAYGALTYKLTKSNRLEFGYLHQYIPQRNGLIVEHNHTLQFAWFSVTPFRKRQ